MDGGLFVLGGLGGDDAGGFGDLAFGQEEVLKDLEELMKYY